MKLDEPSGHMPDIPVSSPHHEPPCVPDSGSERGGRRVRPDEAAQRAFRAELAAAANPTAPLALNQTIAIRRSTDQCVLILDLYNLEPKYGGPFPVIHKPRANTPSYLSVTFKPQHVAEQSFLLTDDAAHALKPQPDGTPRSDPGAAPSAPPVDSAWSGGTQLVFIVPDGLLRPLSSNPLHYDTATLLNSVDSR